MPFTQFPLTPVHASSAAPSAKADALPAAAAVATRAAEGAGAAVLAVPALGATQVPPAGRGRPSHATYIPVIHVFKGYLSDTLFCMWALPEAAVRDGCPCPALRRLRQLAEGPHRMLLTAQTVFQVNCASVHTGVWQGRRRWRCLCPVLCSVLPNCLSPRRAISMQSVACKTTSLASDLNLNM